MKVTHSLEEGFYIIHIAGDCDASTAILLDNEIEKALQMPSSYLLIDCTLLEYISSPGIGVFTSKLTDSQERNIKMVFFGVSESVRKVFKILGLDQFIQIFDSKNEAKSYLAYA